MRKCPFHDCPITDLPDTMFCCRRHWYKLSAPERVEIATAYSEYQKGRLTVEQLRSVQSRVLGARGDAYQE